MQNLADINLHGRFAGFDRFPLDIDNSFEDYGGKCGSLYRDYAVKIQRGDLIAELQLLQAHMMKVKFSRGHVLYEEHRDLAAMLNEMRKKGEVTTKEFLTYWHWVRRVIKEMRVRYAEAYRLDNPETFDPSRKLVRPAQADPNKASRLSV